MVWCGDITSSSSSHSSSRSNVNVDLEMGCFIDLATGLVAFTVNGKELTTSYQVLSFDVQIVYLAVSQALYVFIYLFVCLFYHA